MFFRPSGLSGFDLTWRTERLPVSRRNDVRIPAVKSLEMGQIVSHGPHVRLSLKTDRAGERLVSRQNASVGHSGSQAFILQCPN